MTTVKNASRIAGLFEDCQKQNRRAFIAYLTAGDPTLEATLPLVLALERAGVDLIELGVPFSDPIADGPVIQRASERSLASGATLQKVLDLAKEIRKHSEIPLLLFTYLNPVLRYGYEALAKAASEAGIDGVLLTDLSIEEAEEPVQVLRKQGLDTVFLAAPTSTDKRLELVGRYSSGFVYLVSRTGVTGERASLSELTIPLIQRTRKYTSLPLAVGFGISKPEHVAEVAKFADGIVVGSALVKHIEEHRTDQALADSLQSFTETLTAPLKGPVKG